VTLEDCDGSRVCVDRGGRDQGDLSPPGNQRGRSEVIAMTESVFVQVEGVARPFTISASLLGRLKMKRDMEVIRKVITNENRLCLFLNSSPRLLRAA
jgi:hypothetical protein